MGILSNIGKAVFGSKKEEVAFDPYRFNENSIGTEGNIQKTATRDVAMRAGAELFDILDTTGRLGLSRNGDGELTRSDFVNFVKQFKGVEGISNAGLRADIKHLRDTVPADFRMSKAEFMKEFGQAIDEVGVASLNEAIHQMIDAGVGGATNASVTTDKHVNVGAKANHDSGIEV